jgi:hypothetical protein
MDEFIKEEYICSLSCFERSKSTGLSKNYYWVGGGLCSESNRPYSRLYSSYRLSGRPLVVAFRNLAGYTANSASSLEGVSSLGSGANNGYASQPAGCYRNYYYLGYSSSGLHVLGMANYEWCTEHLTTESKSFAIAHRDAQNTRALYARRYL